jgi:hypothetical protein
MRFWRRPQSCALAFIMFSGSDFHTFFIAGVGCAGSFSVVLDGTRTGDWRYVVLVFLIWIAEEAYDDEG